MVNDGEEAMASVSVESVRGENILTIRLGKPSKSRKEFIRIAQGCMSEKVLMQPNGLNFLPERLNIKWRS